MTVSVALYSAFMLRTAQPTPLNNQGCQILLHIAPLNQIKSNVWDKGQFRIINGLGTSGLKWQMSPWKSKYSCANFHIFKPHYWNVVAADPWWRRQMETFTALLALCEGNSPVTPGFPSQRPVTRSFWCFLWSALDQTHKQTRRRWLETPSCSLWRHCIA